MLPVKAYIYPNGTNFSLETIGHLNEEGTFKFLNKQIKQSCLEALKKTFYYRSAPGGTLTIPDFKEIEDAKTPEQLWRNENCLRMMAKIVKDEGYVVAYSCVYPKTEDGKKFILTYRKQRKKINQKQIKTTTKWKQQES